MPRLPPDSPAAKRQRENETLVRWLTRPDEDRTHPRLTDRELQVLARELLLMPTLLRSLSGDMPLLLPALYQLLQMFVRDVPARPLTVAEEVVLVERLLAGGMPIGQAQEQVARALGKTKSAVARNWQRHQKQKQK